MGEYRAWQRGRADGAGGRGVAGIKYYKGLGSSTAQEAKAYFADLARHTVRMRHTGEPCSEAIRTFFSKHRVEARRELLREVDEDACVDYAADEVTVRDFCHARWSTLATPTCSAPCRRWWTILEAVAAQAALRGAAAAGRGGEGGRTSRRTPPS